MGPTAFTSPPKEGVLRIFFALKKNPTASAGFKPAYLGTKGQHATPRPPKPHNEPFINFSSNYRAKMKSFLEYGCYNLSIPSTQAVQFIMYLIKETIA